MYDVECVYVCMLIKILMPLPRHININTSPSVVLDVLICPPGGPTNPESATASAIFDQRYNARKILRLPPLLAWQLRSPQ